MSKKSQQSNKNRFWATLTRLIIWRLSRTFCLVVLKIVLCVSGILRRKRVCAFLSFKILVLTLLCMRHIICCLLLVGIGRLELLTWRMERSTEHSLLQGRRSSVFTCMINGSLLQGVTPLSELMIWRMEMWSSLKDIAAGFSVSKCLRLRKKTVVFGMSGSSLDLMITPFVFGLLKLRGHLMN